MTIIPPPNKYFTKRYIIYFIISLIILAVFQLLVDNKEIKSWGTMVLVISVGFFGSRLIFGQTRF